MHVILHNRSTDLEKMGKTSLAADSNLSFPYLYLYCPLHILKHFATIMKYCVEWCSVIFERSPDAFLSYTKCVLSNKNYNLHLEFTFNSSESLLSQSCLLSSWKFVLKNEFLGKVKIVLTPEEVSFYHV